MQKADLHIHSKYSQNSPMAGTIIRTPFGKWKYPDAAFLEVRDILQRAKEVGLKIISIADHDSLEGSREAKILAPKFNIIAVSGCEISSAEGHILAYGIKKEIPFNLSPEETVQRIHQQGGLAIAAHPFASAKYRLFRGMMEQPCLRERIYDLDLDGIEVLDACNLGRINRPPEKLIDLAIAKLASTDSHHLFSIGLAYTLFPDWVKNEQDVLRAIKQRLTIPTGRENNAWEVWQFIRHSLSSFWKTKSRINPLAGG